MYCQRIQKTAKLLNIPGSSQKKHEMAENFYLRFEKMFDYKILKQGYISSDEIKGFVNYLAPDVDFFIRELPKDFNCAGAMQPIISSDKTVTGHNLLYNFPGSRNIIKKSDKKAQNTIKHEVRHFFTDIIEPKYVIKLLQKNISQDEANIAYKFYRKILYKNELMGKNLLKKFPNVKMLIIKTKIINFLTKNNFSPEERLEILTKWRLGLKTEQEAYRTDEKNYTETRYLFDKKIKLLEQIIADEMLDAGHDVYRFSRKTSKK